DQQVAVGKEPDDQALDDLLLADDGGRHAALQVLKGVAHCHAVILVRCARCGNPAGRAGGSVVRGAPARPIGRLHFRMRVREERRMRWTTWVVAIGFGLALATSVIAADEQPSKWEFDVMPYAWIAGEFGTLEVAGQTARIDTTLYDVFSLLADGDALGGAGYFGARYGRWSVFVDAVGAVIRNQTVTNQVPTASGTLTVA